MRRRTEEERRAYQQGLEAGMRQAYGNVIHMLMEVGCPPEHHEPIHEAIDAYELRSGNVKREPRSKRFKEMDSGS